MALGELRQRMDGVHPPERAGWIGDVVKDGGAVKNGLAPPTVHLPVPSMQQQPGGVERKSQVHAVAHINPPPRAVFELLTPESNRECVFLARKGQDEIPEGLMNA